jgi:hypothetical protein
LNVPVVRSPITCLHRNHSPKQTHPNTTRKQRPGTRDAKGGTGVRAVNGRQVANDGIGSHEHSPPTLPPVILPLTTSVTELTSDRWSDHRRMKRQIRLPITRHRPVSLPTIQVKTDVRDIAADDAETDSSGHEPRAVPAGEPSASADVCFRWASPHWCSVVAAWAAARVVHRVQSPQSSPWEGEAPAEPN